MRTLALTAIAVAVLALSGCGGDDQSASEQYAGDVCGSLDSWVEDVQGTVSTLGDQGLSITREDVETAVDDVGDATDTLVDDLQGLGAPETEDGDQAKSALDDLTSELNRQLDTVRASLDSGQGAVEITATVTAAISQAATAVQTTYEDLQGLDPAGELRDAFESSDECDALGERLDEIRSSNG